MWNKDLSEFFDTTGYDKEKYPWPFKQSDSKIKPSKIFYAIGDSWLSTNFFKRTFTNKYQDYLLINRSIGGISNSLILNTLKNDLDLLTKSQLDITFLVCFSEVGRSTKDLATVNPSKYKNTNDFFAMILKDQYQQTHSAIKQYPHYITTGFITNNFNSNKSIIDFCGQTSQNKPQDVFTVYSHGILEFLKDRKELFDFDFAEDVKKSITLKDYLEKLEYIDDTLHPNYYKPYELFLQEVFSNLHKHDK